MSKVKQMIPQEQMAIADAIRAKVKTDVTAYHNDKCVHAYIRIIELLLRDNPPQARVKSDGMIEFIMGAVDKEKIGQVQSELTAYAKGKYPMLFVKPSQN